MPPSIPDRRRIFVSYHHELDQDYQQRLVRDFGQLFDVIQDNSLDREIDSDDPEYVMRRIREEHLKGSSVTVVLCGAQTPFRKYVDWEIRASLNQRMGVVAVVLPTARMDAPGSASLPGRLQDNVDTGYSPRAQWDDVSRPSGVFRNLIEFSLQTSKARIDNTRSPMRRNAPSGGW